MNTESSYKGGKITDTNKTDQRDSDYNSNNDHSTIDQMKKQLYNNSNEAKNLASSVYFSNISHGNSGTNNNVNSGNPKQLNDFFKNENNSISNNSKI